MPSSKLMSMFLLKIQVWKTWFTVQNLVIFFLHLCCSEIPCQRNLTPTNILGTLYTLLYVCV